MFRKKRLFAVALAIFALLVSLSTCFNVAEAQTAGYLIKDDMAGPYHLSIWASPNPISVGNVKLTLRLGQKGGIAQEWPVRSARIDVQFKQITGPGTENQPKELLKSNVLVAPESDPGTYEVADSLPAEGTYQIVINIDANLGKTHYEFPVKALPQPDDRFFSVLLLVLLALFIFGLVFAYLRQPGHPAEKNSEGQKVPSPETKTPSEEPVKS